MFDLLIDLIVVVGIISIAMWALGEFNPPRPVRILVVCAIAIFSICMLASLAGWHPPVAFRG